MQFPTPIKVRKYHLDNNRKHPSQITLARVNFFATMEFLLHLQLFLVFVRVEEQDSHIWDRKMKQDDEIKFLLICFRHFSVFFDYMFINIDDKIEEPY